MLFFLLFVIGVFSTFNYNVNEQLIYKYVGTTFTSGTVNPEGEHIEISALLKLVCLEKDAEKQMYKMSMVLEDVFMGNNDDEKSKVFFDGEYGAWLVFDLSFKGEVGNLYGETPNEDEEYLQVKYNALDALQTYYEEGGMTDGIVSFSGVNGIVNAKIQVSATDGDSDVVERSYNQADFTTFADPSIDEMINEEQIFHFTGVHTHEIKGGIIKNIEIRHEHKVHSEEKKEDSISSNEDEGKGNAFIYGTGKTVITLIQRKTLTKEEILKKIGVRDYSVSENTNTLFNFGKDYAEDIKDAQGVFDLEEKIDESLNIIMTLGEIIRDDNKLKVHKIRLYHANRLIYLLKGNPDYYPTFASKISCEAFQPSHRFTKETMFFVLAELGTKEAQDDMIYHGYHGWEVESSFLAILASFNLENPTEEIFSALLGIFTNAEMPRDLKNAAILVYGVLVDKVKEEEKVGKDGLISDIMVKKLLLLLDKLDEETIDDIFAILYALKNAEVKITSSKVYAKLLSLDVEKISTLANELYDGFKIPLPQSDASDFPYSKGKTYSKTLGEEYATVSASAEFYAGTNFDCNKKTFNYKAYGELKAEATVFGKTKSLANGKIIYGKKGSKVVGNEMYFSLLGKTIYQKTLKTLNYCKEQEQNLYHTQHVFSLSYTVMLGVVPVNLGVDGDIIINVDYGWKLCSDNLYADVKLLPGVNLILTGSAALSVVAVKGGAYIDVSFNMKLVPRVYIKGTECSVGADLKYIVTPFVFDFGLFYQTRECSIERWTLGCDWEEMKKKKLVHTQFDSISKTLWEREYKIK